MDLGGWLRSLGLGQYEAAFRENAIDLSILPDLTDQDLEKIGVLLGHRRKLLRAIANLELQNASASTVATPATTDASPRDTAERRHVTVMFSDLVGSTALSARMDPEDLREIISAYQKCVADTEQRFGGFVAKYMGDGVLVYFGYPQAHEDDAERAVRAGLELVAAVGQLKTHAPLQTRVGIATGLVVVGDLIARVLPRSKPLSARRRTLRRGGRGSHYLPPRDTGRRAQLGLPLHVDARRDFHAPGTLHWLNLDWEADEFMQFIADVETTEDGSLQIMYGIDGRRELPESTRDDLSGYAGARPVRVGNAAFSQRQNDVFGAVLDSILLHTRRNERLPRRLWPIGSQAECASRVWRDPEQGIWEARGKPQHYVSSKLMCWVALDRASSLAEIRGDPKLAATWRATADKIRADVLTHGVSDRGVLRRHYETNALDASTLLAGSFKFLAHDDKRLRNTVLAVAEELTENGFVLRYRTDETDDGLSGKEGTFLICSFWLVSAFAIVGEMQRARDLMERLLRIASPLGLYAEEFDPETGRHLGNFPQAFSHLALIEAAARMIVPALAHF